MVVRRQGHDSLDAALIQPHFARPHKQATENATPESDSQSGIQREAIQDEISEIITLCMI